MAKSYSLILILLFSACTHSIKMEPRYDANTPLALDEGVATGKYVTAASYQTVLPTLARTNLIFRGKKTKIEIKLDLNAQGDTFTFKAPADDYELNTLSFQTSTESPSKISVSITPGKTTDLGTLYSSCSDGIDGWDNRSGSSQVFRDLIIQKQYRTYQLYHAEGKWSDCLVFVKP